MRSFKVRPKKKDDWQKGPWLVSMPGHTGYFSLSGDEILANNVVLPGEYNPHNVRLWLIGSEFGPRAMVWGDNETTALDEAVDAGLLDADRVSDEDFEGMSREERDELVYLGNASEPFHQDYMWMGTVNRKESPELMAAFAVAREEGKDHL